MKNNKFISILLGLLVLMTSCDDNKDEFLSDFDTIFYFLNSGEQDLTLYKTGENADYSITINKAGSNLNSSGSVSVSVLSNEQIEAYNLENGTSYTALPEATYEFMSQTSIDFGSGEQYKFLDVQFKTDDIGDLSSTGNYVLPLELHSEDSVNVEKQVVIISPVVEIPSVYFTKSGYASNMLSDKGEERITLTLPVTISAENKWEFECEVEVDEDLIDTYNQENDVNYILLPTDAYSLSGDGNVVFTSADQIVDIEIEVDRTKIGYGNYILPLRLTECSKDAFEINQDMSTCLFGVSYTPDISDLVAIDLTASMLSSNAVEPTEGSLANLLDGNTGTYFHSAWSVSVANSHYIQVGLSESVSAISFDFIGRSTNGNGNPKTIVIYSSLDGTTFEKVSKIAQEELPTGALASYTSPVVVMPESKYIRFVVPQNMNGGSYFVFSEFSMKGL